MCDLNYILGLIERWNQANSKLVHILIFDRLRQHVNSFVRFSCWIQIYFRPWQQYCIIAPPQFASPDEAR